MCVTLGQTSIIKPNPDFDQFRKVLSGSGKPDYVPFYELYVNFEQMAAALGRELRPDAEAIVEFYYRAGYDYVPVWPGMDLPRGSLVDRSQGYPISDWRSFETYPWPAPSSLRYDDFLSVAAILPDGMKIIGQTGGIFETAQELVGYEQLCYLLIDDPKLVAAIFERLGDIYEAMYRGMAQIEAVGAVVISDDMGFKTQTLISADDLRTYVLPWHQRLAEIVHAHDKPCIFHSCGQLCSVMEDLIEDVKIDAKHSFEDSIQPVEEFAKQYIGRISVLGGFDVDRLCRSNTVQIRERVRMLMVELGKSGRYALGSGNSIPGYVPIENYLALLDEGWKMRMECARR